MSYQTTLSLVAALAILLSAQTVPGQSLQSLAGETAVGLKEASSHFLVFYMDDLDKGGVPAGDRSVDLRLARRTHSSRRREGLVGSYEFWLVISQ